MPMKDTANSQPTSDDIQLLKQIWEHFDGIEDGAPDASYHAKMALGFSQPLKRLIERLEEDAVHRELNQAHATGSDRAWDEAVARLRDEGLLR